MASSSGTGTGAKPQFSSSLMRLKFMQKGLAKRQQPEAEKVDNKEDAAEEAPKLDESKWTATTFVAKGCRVVVERDPPPEARSGRMSFGRKPEVSIEQTNAEQAAAAAAAAAAAGDPKQQAPAKLGKHGARSGLGEDEVLPLRMPKRQRR